MANMLLIIYYFGLTVTSKGLINNWSLFYLEHVHHVSYQ